MKKKFMADEPTLCFFSQTGDPVIIESAARSGFECVIVDAQHGPYSPVSLRTQMQAIEAGGAFGMVRIPFLSIENVGVALDSGAYGVIAPLVNTAKDAEDLVRFAKYPPCGIRSYGKSRRSVLTEKDIDEVNESISLFAMIETSVGLENVDAIAAVDGLDGLYIGPTDLNLAVGGRFHNDPSVRSQFEKAVEKILGSANSFNKVAAFHGRDIGVVGRRFAQGFCVGVIASELTMLAKIFDSSVTEFRELVDK